MGLDTYSSKPDVNYGEINLCGGMMSANGQGSFRGKVYNEFVESITDESLYQEEISNKVVRRMAYKLTKYIEDNTAKTHKDNGWLTAYTWEITWEEAKNLAKWFRVTAGNNANVKGWW